MAGTEFYDGIGTGYSLGRRTDPRWMTAILAAPGTARSIADVGTGTGSYEPDDRQAPAWLIPGQQLDPAFDVVDTLSTLHQWFTHVRLLGSHLTHQVRLSVTLTTTAHSPQQLTVLCSLLLQSDYGGPL